MQSDVITIEAKEQGIAFQLWPACQLLCRYLLANQHVVRGKRVLELGAGCGRAGLTAAAAGAAQTATRAANLHVFMDEDLGKSGEEIGCAWRCMTADIRHMYTFFITRVLANAGALVLKVGIGI